MKEEGAEVKVVGAGGAQSYTSKHGYPVTVDVQAEAVSAWNSTRWSCRAATRPT